MTTCAATEVNWPCAAQVCVITRERFDRKTGKATYERVSAVTSLNADEASAGVLLRLAREHWSIENSLHYVRDVTLGEDACRTRSGNAPQALAAVRNTVIGLLHMCGIRNIASTLRRYAGKVVEALALVGIEV